MALPGIDDYPAVYGYRFCPLCGAALRRRQVGHRERLACPADGWTFYPATSLAAAVVVEHAGGVVLLRRAIPPDVGIWHLPHGHLEFGEAPAAGAAREAFEETGLTLDEPAFLDYEHSPSYSDRRMWYLILCFRARAVGGEPRVDVENQEVRVFPADALPEMKWTSHRRALAAWRAWREGRPWVPGRRLTGDSPQAHGS
jgi:ADP-ribose pyrophosphatase YjhB (NUDIX family)